MANTKDNTQNVRNNIRNNWDSIKGKVRQQYGELTDDDLQYQEGQEEQLLGRIQQRTGRSQDEIGEFIDSVSNFRGTDDTDNDQQNREGNQNPGRTGGNRDNQGPANQKDQNRGGTR